MRIFSKFFGGKIRTILTAVTKDTGSGKKIKYFECKDLKKTKL